MRASAPNFFALHKISAALAIFLAACSGSSSPPSDLSVTADLACVPPSGPTTLYLASCTTGAFGFCFQDHVSLDFF